VKWFLLFLPGVLAAQPSTVASGAKVFVNQCSVPYCHGSEGTRGRAPALAGRSFDSSFLRSTITQGISGRGMPAFESKLTEADLDAVIEYVLSLSGPKPVAAASPASSGRVKLPTSVADGRDLFFESARMPSCGACHTVAGIGGSIGPALSRANSPTRESLSQIEAPDIVTAQTSNELPFQAISEPSQEGEIRVADLSSPLPVIRTFRKANVTLTQGAKWAHSSAVSRYSDVELQLILNWLGWTWDNAPR
jgi:mono/diheme cytochrome c family protein